MGSTGLATAQLSRPLLPVSPRFEQAAQPQQDTSHHRVEALEVIPGLFVIRWFFHTFPLHYCNIGVNIL